MPEPSVQQLFRQWRGGDAEAGKVMAQKFSDWYYAVTTVRVADRSGREPLERACQAFAQGIIGVTRPSALVDWAHDLLERELQTIGRGLDAGPSVGGDHPNALTKNQSPTQLIQAAATSMDAAQLQLLANAFNSATPIGEVEQLGDDMGGLPFAMLDARYALKRALHTSADIPFAVVPDDADMDRAPISLYEAGRLASGEEVCALEKWLLTDIDLCKDIAEFSAFVHALRGGALAKHRAVSAAQAPAPQPAPPAPPAPAAPEPEPVAPEPDGEADDLLVDPDDLDVAGAEMPAPAPEPEPEPEPTDAPHEFPAATPEPPEAPSTLRNILTIAAVLVAGIGVLLAAMVWLLRG